MVSYIDSIATSVWLPIQLCSKTGKTLILLKNINNFKSNSFLYTKYTDIHFLSKYNIKH